MLSPRVHAQAHQPPGSLSFALRVAIVTGSLGLTSCTAEPAGESGFVISASATSSSTTGDATSDSGGEAGSESSSEGDGGDGDGDSEGGDGDGDGDGDSDGGDGDGDATGSCVADELCNGVDDDCDMVVDNGCPLSVSRGPTFMGQALGDDDGGTAYDDPCPADHVVIGFRGMSGSRLDQVQAICAGIELVIDTSQTPEYGYALGTTTEIDGAVHGLGGGTAFEERCSANEVVIGFDGQSGDEVDRFAFTCGLVTFARQSDTWDVSISPTTTSTTWGTDSAGALAYTCPDAVAAGIHGRAGDRVDRLGYYCAPILVVDE